MYNGIVFFHKRIQCVGAILMNRFSVLVFSIFVTVLTISVHESCATVTIPYGVRRSNDVSSEDYIIEAGGCFHVIPASSDTTPSNIYRYYANNFQIAGQGFYITSNGTQETSGAIRICVNGNSPQLVTHNYFAGTVTLSANATIGIQQNTAIKNAYFTSFAASDASYVLTLNPYESTDTICIVSNNDSFTNPISVVQSGTVQVGKIASAPITVYSQIDTSESHTFHFDGTAGSLGTGTISVASSAKLKFERSGNVTIGNVLSGAGKVIFGGDARYTFSSANSLTGVTGTVSIDSDASLKLFAANTQTSGSVAFSGSGTLIFGYNSNNNTIQNYTGIANITGFTGTVLMADSYRWSYGPGTYTSLPYKIGATDGGQIFLNSNGNYVMDLYVEGLGIQASEAFGAIRMIGQSDYAGAMTNLSGTVHLTNDTRVSAANTPKSGNGVSATHNQGMISGQIFSKNAVDKAALRINGNAFNNTYTHMILTGANDYGKTYIENRAILQIGYNGSVNGSTQYSETSKYDGTTGTAGTDAIVFCAANAAVGTAADLGGKLIFARTNACTVGNSIAGTGTVEFTSGGAYTLTNTASLSDFSGKITVNQGSSLTLNGQNLSAETSILLDDGSLLGSGTISGTLTMNSGAFSSGISVTQDDLALVGTYIANLDAAQSNVSLTSVSGTMSLANGSTIQLTSSDFSLLDPGASFQLLEGDASSFEGLDLTTLTVKSGIGWDLSLVSAQNGNLILTAAASVPEPSAITLLLAAVGFGGVYVWKKKRI